MRQDLSHTGLKIMNMQDAGNCHWNFGVPIGWVISLLETTCSKV